MNEPSKPPDEGLSRRSLFRRGGALAATAGVGAALAGCENTTTPVAADGAGAAAARASSATRPRAAPSTAAGIPLARRDYPVVLPALGDVVASSAKPERGGELQIYNYADYLNPAILKAFGKQEGVSVRVTTFDTLDEAFSKLSTGGLEFDVIFSTPDQLSRLVGAQAHPAAELRADPEPAEERLARAAQPVLRRRPALQRPLHDLHDGRRRGATTSSTSIPASSTSRGTRSGRRPRSTAARSAILDDSREAPGMALMRRGVTDLNTEDPDAARAGRRRPRAAQRQGRREGLDRRLRDRAGRALVLHQAWSGDMIAGVISYMPKGVKPDVLSYWYQTRAARSSTTSSAWPPTRPSRSSPTAS